MGNSEQKPAIRFQGFSDAWEQRKLEAVVNSVDTGKSKFDKEGSTGEYPILGSTSVIGYDDEYDYEGDFILTARVGANAGSLYRHAGKVKISDNTVFIQASQNIEFLYHLLTQFDIKKLSFGTGQPLVKASELKNLELMMPTDINEQMKIGDYFRNLDNLITLHHRKYDKLVNVKKSMLEKVFPENGSLFPEIRFEGFTDAWEQRKLGEISDKVTRKNQDVAVEEVFTNSAEFGIISQRDFFDKDIANAENIDGYYVVEPDDFVYNPRISTTAPFGPIKRNKLERTGAMSPLYYVFRPHDIDLSYLEWFFQTTCWHAFMRFNGNSGARSDRFAITDRIFNEMPISMPQDIEEQKKIGAFLTELEFLITLHQCKLEKLKNIKKSMLEKMFV